MLLVEFTAPSTLVKVYLNSLTPTTHTLTKKFIRDISPSVFKLGSLNPDGVGNLKGFIAYVKTGNDNLVNTSMNSSYGNCGISAYPTNSVCTNCPEGCKEGCANSSKCKPDICSDPLCTSCPADFEKCSTCAEYSYLIESIGVCSCVANSSYDKTSNACRCNFGYSPYNGNCVECLDYIYSSNVVSAAYNTDYSAIIITFKVPIHRDRITSCDDLFKEDNYALIGSKST